MGGTERGTPPRQESPPLAGDSVLFWGCRVLWGARGTAGEACSHLIAVHAAVTQPPLHALTLVPAPRGGQQARADLSFKARGKGLRWQQSRLGFHPSKALQEGTSRRTGGWPLVMATPCPRQASPTHSCAPGPGGRVRWGWGQASLVQMHACPRGSWTLVQQVCGSGFSGTGALDAQVHPCASGLFGCPL